MPKLKTCRITLKELIEIHKKNYSSLLYIALFSSVPIFVKL